MVELAVQLVGRLVRQHVQRITLGGLAAEPFDRLDPGRVAGAVVVAERGDLLGEDLDLARGSLQGIGGGVGPELRQHHRLALLAARLRDAGFPESLEGREGDAGLRRLLARFLVQVGEPLHCIATLGVDVVGAEAAGDLGEDPVVVTGLADRRARLLHGDQVRLLARVADVVALQPGGGRQYDVGHLGRRRPELFVEDDRLGLAPGIAQPIEILVVMERIAARPVDQADVGIGEFLAVVRDLAARIEQHVGEARDRDEVGHRVGALRQRRAGESRRVAAHDVGRPVARAEAAARQADLAQHAGKRHQRPEGLLAVMAALQRPVDVHGRAGRGHLARQAADARSRNAGDLLGPLRCLVPERRRESVEAHGAAVEELPIVELLGEQHVAQYQDQGGVGVGPDLQPFDGAAGVEILGGRRDIDEAHAPGVHAVEAGLQPVHHRAAGVDLRVLARRAAEGDEQLAVLGQHVPGRVHGHQVLHAGHDVRHQHACRPQAVGIDVTHVAAERVQEAMDLALRVMEAAGARPAVRAAEDRAIGVRLAHPLDLVGHDVERLVPGQFDERLLSALVARGPRTLLEPALAHRRPAHAQARHIVGQHVQTDRRGIGILRERVQADRLALVVVFDFVDAPVGRGERALVGHLMSLWSKRA